MFARRRLSLGVAAQRLSSGGGSTDAILSLLPMVPLMSRTLRIGLSVGTRSLTATWREHGVRRDWSAPISVDATGQPSAEVVHAALGELRSVVPTPAHVVLAIAILPPLARLRHIELPRMTDEERCLAVSRTIERYFLGLPEPVLCAVESRKGGTATASPFIAAAVSGSLITNLSVGAAALGWGIDRIVPAHAVWAAAAIRRWPELGRGEARVLVEGESESTLLTLGSSSIRSARRLRPSDAQSETTRGPTNRPSKAFGAGTGPESSAFIAAGDVIATREFEFVSDDERRIRSSRQTRVARWLMGIAAACLLAATGSYRWSLSRQLDALTAQRTALRSRVNRAMAARDTLTSLSATLGAMASLEQSAPRWSAVLSRIAVALPQDASLIGLRADGDTVTVEGQAQNAAAIFGALRLTSGVIAVRATAPIRQELTVGQNAVERWTLSLRVVHDAAVRGTR
jgi:Tfp pilus assembly protein PilN